MPGIPIELAQTLIRECIEADMSGKLETLRPMLAQNSDVIQVNCLCVVGTPVGPKDYVREYVRNKCGTICKDIEQMRVCADPLIRYQLLKFCMNTRLSFLSRNVIPTIWQQIAMTVHTLALPTSTTRLYMRCSVPPQATPSCRRLRSCRSGANSKFNPRTTMEGTR